MLSRISPGISNCKYYDQAARNVACMAETVRIAGRDPRDMNLGFYVMAPQAQIDKGTFSELQRESIQQKVLRRAREYGDERETWFNEWFLPCLHNMNLGTLSWEQVIATIRDKDPLFRDELGEFYERCLEFNKPKISNP